MLPVTPHGSLNAHDHFDEQGEQANKHHLYTHAHALHLPKFYQQQANNPNVPGNSPKSSCLTFMIFVLAIWLWS